MDTLNKSLGQPVPPINIPKFYVLDTSKINNLEDIKNILSILEIGITDAHPNFENVKHCFVKK